MVRLFSFSFISFNQYRPFSIYPGSVERTASLGQVTQSAPSLFLYSKSTTISKVSLFILFIISIANLIHVRIPRSKSTGHDTDAWSSRTKSRADSTLLEARHRRSPHAIRGRSRCYYSNAPRWQVLSLLFKEKY